METLTEQTYMRYGRDLEIPVFIKYNSGNQLPDLLNFLVGLKFELVTKEQLPGVLEQIEKNPNARVLELCPITPQVARHLSQTVDSDRFGPESVRKEQAMRFYRYVGEAIMLYSFGHKEWRLGCYENFGVEKSKMVAHRSIIARFLSLALISTGMVGFWGWLVKDGVVVTRQKESEGEFIFYDLFRQKIFALDGVANINKHASIYRVDPSFANGIKKMSSEELYAFLALNTTWLEADGTSTAWRQVTQRLAMQCQGIITSREGIKGLDLPT
jgi:hypothetical protein